MGVEQDGDAPTAQLLQELAHDAAPSWVERARGFVEQQQARRANQRLRDPQSLLHPLRQGLHAPLGRVHETDELEQAQPLSFTARGAGETLMQLEHLVGFQPRLEPKELREVAD
jgi:hypothetical protein